GSFARTAKSIALPAEARALLGLEAASATPNEIMRAILRAPVDLLWNGGIGTYVKAQDERNAEVGDRANDALRINGRELRAKVVGEGGNLGLTQRGRVEYALAGGRLNTDFIDNSAGVNTSDVEVNIKILLNPLVQAGKLARGERNRLLARMTNEVAALVLRNNYLQSQAISTLELKTSARLAEYQHLIRREITSTAPTNGLVNRMGPTFVPRAQEDTGAEPAQIARAYTAAREIFEMRDLWTQIEALDTRVPAKLQYGIAFETSRLLRHVTYWLLAARRRELQVDAAVAEFRSGVRQLE